MPLPRAALHQRTELAVRRVEKTARTAPLPGYCALSLGSVLAQEVPIWRGKRALSSPILQIY
jgi:hypothetical protein